MRSKVSAWRAPAAAKRAFSWRCSSRSRRRRLAKEYASQGPLAKKAAEYVAAMDDLEAAKVAL